MATRYPGVLAKDLQGEDRNKVLALMGRARLLVGRALKDLKFANKQQVHLRERQADGSLIHAMVTDFGAGAPIRKVWIEVPPVPSVEPELPTEVGGRDLFFWQDQDTGNRFVLNLSSSGDWAITEAPSYIEYGTVDDELALSDRTETWVGDSKEDVLVWDVHQTGIYGYEGSEIVPADAEAERWSGYSGGCLYKGVPVVVEMATGEAWAVRGADKGDWDSLGVVWVDDYGDFYLDISFDQSGEHGIAVTKGDQLMVAPTVVRVELNGDADNISMGVTEDDSDYFFDKVEDVGDPWTITTTTQHVIWDVGFYHNKETLFEEHSFGVTELYRAAPPVNYSTDIAINFYGFGIPEFGYDIHLVQNDTGGLGDCVSFSSLGRFSYNMNLFQIATQTMALTVADNTECNEEGWQTIRVSGKTVEIWADNTYGVTLPGNIAVIKSLAHTNDMAVAFRVEVTTYGVPRGTPNLVEDYFFAYYDGKLTDLAGQVSGKVSDMVNLCSLRGKV